MGARCAWQLWKTNKLGPGLKCPKADGVAGALKPYGLGYGAQACYCTSWGLSFPFCQVGHRIAVENTGADTRVTYWAGPMLAAVVF